MKQLRHFGIKSKLSKDNYSHDLNIFQAAPVMAAKGVSQIFTTPTQVQERRTTLPSDLRTFGQKLASGLVPGMAAKGVSNIFRKESPGEITRLGTKTMPNILDTGQTKSGARITDIMMNPPAKYYPKLGTVITPSSKGYSVGSDVKASEIFSKEIQAGKLVVNDDRGLFTYPSTPSSSPIPKAPEQNLKYTDTSGAYNDKLFPFGTDAMRGVIGRTIVPPSFITPTRIEPSWTLAQKIRGEDKNTTLRNAGNGVMIPEKYPQGTYPTPKKARPTYKEKYGYTLSEAIQR